MPPSKTKPKAQPDRRPAAAIIGVVAILLGGLAYWAWSDAPQLDADSDVYASLDALFTAVTARREPLVSDCETKLALLHSDGKIPEQAWRRITHVIELARAGEWESSALELYRFIERQKRSPKSAHLQPLQFRDTRHQLAFHIELPPPLNAAHRQR